MHTIIISVAFTLLLSLSLNAQNASHDFNPVEATDNTLAELQKSVKDNPEDILANNEIATYYYNKGVALISSMDYDGDQDKLADTQSKIELLFAKALPFADKVHSIDPHETNTIKILSGIYFGLNDMEKHDFYEKLLEKAIEKY